MRGEKRECMGKEKFRYGFVGSTIYPPRRDAGFYSNRVSQYLGCSVKDGLFLSLVRGRHMCSAAVR